ncbi:MAG: RNA polymerase sigma factor [Pedobacter sp.]|nr:MAG: RNA polymerase sigma factor [Pedobacter sp.]
MNTLTSCEHHLIEQCKLGNAMAQKTIFEKYSPRMLAMVARYARDKMEAEDIVMLGFLKVFSKISTFTGNGSFEGWIRRIMVNCALNLHQQNLRRINTVPIDQARNLQVGTDTSICEMQYLLAVIQSIPCNLRIPFNLFAIEGYSHKEIARELEITEALSKTRVNRARKALQAALSTDFHSVLAA